MDEPTSCAAKLYSKPDEPGYASDVREQSRLPATDAIRHPECTIVSSAGNSCAISSSVERNRRRIGEWTIRPCTRRPHLFERHGTAGCREPADPRRQQERSAMPTADTIAADTFGK